MKLDIARLLASFGYKSWVQLGESLAPTFKYQLTWLPVITSAISATIARVFGIDALAFAGLLLAFMVELVSGIQASKIRGEAYESFKLSRFSFKTCCYLILIALPYLFAVSYEARGKTGVSMVCEWFHIFLVLQTIHELVVSILENLGTISGKPKTHWISAIRKKVNGFFKNEAG